MSENWYQIRYRKQIYFRKYREPNFVRKQMLAICEPIMAKDKRPHSERCINLLPKAERQIHPYDKLLAEDMKQELRSSRMICFFHQNVMTIIEKRETRNLFQKEDMFLRYYNPDIAQMAMNGTKYESALHLAKLPNFTILFSAEPQVSKLLKLNKKCPQLILLAAIIDDRFLSVEDIKAYSRLPDLQTMRSELSHTLSLAAKSLSNKTIYPISNLTNSLDLYIKDQQK